MAGVAVALLDIRIEGAKTTMLDTAAAGSATISWLVCAAGAGCVMLADTRAGEAVAFFDIATDGENRDTDAETRDGVAITGPITPCWPEIP